MDDYKDLVEVLFRENSSKIFDNSSPDHAAVLLETMFKYGKRCIRIFSGCLSDDVYGRESLIREVKEYLCRREGSLTIILQDQLTQAEVLAKKLLVAILSDHKYSEVISKRLQVFIAQPSHSNLNGHFSTMDGIAFRLETNKEKKEAVASASNASNCVELDRVFDIIFSTATPVSLIAQTEGR